MFLIATGNRIEYILGKAPRTIGLASRRLCDSSGIDSTRRFAMSDKLFDGNPCSICGGTLRFKSNGSCTRCHYERRRNNKALVKEKNKFAGLSPDAWRLRNALAEKWGIPPKAVIEIAIRQMAQRDGVD